MANMMGRIMVICLAIISTSSSPLGDSRSISDRLKPSNGNEKSPIKKAYTYVSEYKRLPEFNFGIGKRWSGINGNKGAQPYSFGFGKRSASANVYPLRMGMNYLPYDAFENYLNDDMSAEESGRPSNNIKRSGRIRLYDFGLGKRMIPHFSAANSNENPEDSQAIRKFLSQNPSDERFVFGSSNRFAEDQEDVQEGD